MNFVAGFPEMNLYFLPCKSGFPSMLQKVGQGRQCDWREEPIKVDLRQGLTGDSV